MTSSAMVLLVATATLWVLPAAAQVPALVHHQGRIGVGDSLFDGTGRFKFAFVNADGSQTFWRNAPDNDADGEPDQAVLVPVNRGLYSVLLGDSALGNMAVLTPAVFQEPAVYLRVWFDDGVNGSERLAPDQRFAAVGYAMVAANVPDGTISPAKLAPGVLDTLSGQLAGLATQVDGLNTRLTTLERASVAGLPAGVPLVSSSPADAALTALGLSTFMTVPSPGWKSATGRGALSARYGHTAVWTGRIVLVWGGALGGGLLTASGAGYDPTLDEWRALSDLDSPEARRGHSAVWTGQSMIVWGGFGTTYLNTGAEYVPETFRWRAIPSIGPPAARDEHLAVWTGSRMIVWGGRNATGLLDGGALYDPVGGTWAALPPNNAPAGRVGAVGAWSGTSFLVWGGLGESGELATGAALPIAGGVTAGGWTELATAGAPSARVGHTGVWTGDRLLIWGGRAGNTLLDDGAAYHPADNTWTPLSTVGAPTARFDHLAVWTGQEMLIVGGETASGSTASGAAYNPTSGTWRSLTGTGAPVARSEAVGVWTDTELLVFGGRANGLPVGAMQRLNPQPAWYFYRKP